jgi:hypothetical protein
MGPPWETGGCGEIHETGTQYSWVVCKVGARIAGPDRLWGLF